MATSSVVRVEGDVGGQIIVGDHNVVISAQYGSTAVLRPEGPPPVRRRERPAGRTLRRRPVTLFGREGELATVDQWLGDGHVVQVYGPPGIGKSSLLRRYAAGQSALDRDIVFLPAAGLPVEDVIQELFHACFDTEGYKPEHSRVRRLMGAVQALLVVDDFEGSPKDLAALADAAPGCDLLVAAVDRCVSDEVRTLRLGGLSEDAALDLVARELGRTPEGAERDAVRDLVGTVDGHPLTLVQMSAAVRAAEVSGEEHADGAFTAGETALAVGVAGRLDDVAVRLLRVLSAVSPLPVSSGLLYALAGDVGPSAGACAAEVLEQSHLIEQEGSGYHCLCDLASRVVRHTGRVPEAGELAAGLTDWLRTGTTRQEAAAEAAVIGRVLADAARRGDHAAVRDLARAAAPVLARSLHWGSWRSVLEHGRAAAAALGCAADEAYFAHEEEVRRKALGLAAAVVVTAAGGGVGAGAAAVHNALAAGGKSTTATGKAGLGALASKPAVIATAVAALISAGVFVALADTGGGQPAADPPPAPAVSVYGPHSPPVQPRTSPPWPSAPEPSVPSPSVSPPTPVPRLSLPGNSGGCVPAPMPAPDFGRSRTHERTTRQVDFDAWLPCDDEKSLDVTDKQNWAVALTACPPPQGSRLCRFAVTFQPSSPGTHHATVTIHDDWGHDDLSMEVTGVAVDAAPSTPVSPSVPLEPSDPVSPTQSTRTPRPGPSEPLPSTT
ncbi:ATP-binding protein [Streptomyces anandii]|uniref:ATP-binding protein n=1 Tax=Streptomyces anandii TaxID=285454 RepID=UPI0037B47FC9